MVQKLLKYGVRNNELMWFQSYLTDHKQVVKCNGHTSTPLPHVPVTIGILQGSVILSIALFINDIMQHVVHNSQWQCNLYAVGTLLYVSGDSVLYVNSKLQCAVDESGS